MASSLSNLRPELGVPFNDFTRRRRCSCIAKSTGLQCGSPAMRFSKRCRIHGGRGDQIAALRRMRKQAAPGTPRTAARRILWGMTPPDDFPAVAPSGFELERLNRTTLRKGWLAFLNRETDPKGWRGFLAAAPMLPRRDPSDKGP